jgi:cysteine desulfurase/selenocysteine lyase
MIDVKTIKKDFPIFKRQDKLTFLDSASTSLKPHNVIETLSSYYDSYSANVHRGLYPIAERATKSFESSRVKIAEFISSPRVEEVVFTKGATEGLNLIASSLEKLIGQVDGEVVTTISEHHANFIPWQQLSKKLNLKFKVIALRPDSQLDIYEESSKTVEKNINLSRYINSKTKILALSTASNVIGNTYPVKEIIQAAKKINPLIITIVDACQSITHEKIDVGELDCDFLVFSGHKMLGPTGVGVLWGKKSILDMMPPYQVGGGMIKNVSITDTTWADVPYKFEAGTPPIAEVIGLSAAIEYLNRFSLEDVRVHISSLSEYFINAANKSFGDNIQIFTPQKPTSTGIVSFNLNSIHSHDVAQILGESNICIRAGHHCTMPLHTFWGVSSTCRISFYIYNSQEDVDILLAALKKVFLIFNKSI